MVGSLSHFVIRSPSQAPWRGMVSVNKTWTHRGNSGFWTEGKLLRKTSGRTEDGLKDGKPKTWPKGCATKMTEKGHQKESWRHLRDFRVTRTFYSECVHKKLLASILWIFLWQTNIMGSEFFFVRGHKRYLLFFKSSLLTSWKTIYVGRSVLCFKTMIRPIWNPDKTRLRPRTDQV